jgi:hypothetical protein
VIEVRPITVPVYVWACLVPVRDDPVYPMLRPRCRAGVSMERKAS